MDMRTRAAHLAAAVALVAIAPAAGQAQDVAAGRQKAQMCAVCHGLDGIGRNPDVPNLAGESPIYVKAQLEAYRSGDRQHQQMSIIAQDLTDEDISDLAAWYSALKVTVEMPQ